MMFGTFAKATEPVIHWSLDPFIIQMRVQQY